MDFLRNAAWIASKNHQYFLEISPESTFKIPPEISQSIPPKPFHYIQTFSKIAPNILSENLLQVSSEFPLENRKLNIS